jgi:Holliday junction resolvase-like predicted endonuclease
LRVERKINRRQQGDLGEASAIEWLASVGATVFIPFGHSPDVDLVACAYGRLVRIQVKTSTQRLRTPGGHARHAVTLATNGGNQSWSGTTKKADPTRFDYLFVVVGDGRRWFIPSTALEASSSITLGGRKYSEFEIEPGRSIDRLVYGEDRLIESKSKRGEYPSGQRTATVNRQAQPSQVRILPPPFRSRTGFQHSKYERSRGQSGQCLINQKRRVTLPQLACIEASFQDGDRLLARSDGDGRVVLERIDPPPSAVVSSKC